MAETFEIQVNGKSHQITGDPATSLLLALRNDLGLRATRHGCATGNCGACTVLIDNRAVTSCTETLEAAGNRHVETIEAIKNDAIGKTLVAAFLAGQAGQCGYCLAGILMQAKALLSTNPRPSRPEIAAALDGNLCRCGAHNRILDAIERAAAELAGGKAA